MTVRAIDGAVLLVWICHYLIENKPPFYYRIFCLFHIYIFCLDFTD